MILRVVEGKGGKDRDLPLSPALLETLREYWRWRKPKTYLFPSRDPRGGPEQPISDKTVWIACNEAARRAGMRKRVTPHTRGGLSPDHRQWVRPRYPFSLPVKVLSRVFRGKFLAGLKRLHRCEPYEGSPVAPASVADSLRWDGQPQPIFAKRADEVSARSRCSDLHNCYRQRFGQRVNPHSPIPSEPHHEAVGSSRRAPGSRNAREAFRFNWWTSLPCAQQCSGKRGRDQHRSSSQERVCDRISSP